MLLVMYVTNVNATDACERAGCDNLGWITAIAADGRIRETLCDVHAAKHMRGNAYALDPEDEPDAWEAELMNELDNL